MGKIFISYRRDDSEYIVGRIYEDLCTAYGQKNIFKDVDSIPLGVDFRNEISKVVNSCDILLALIGEKWNTIADDDGNPRINDPADFVRIEIEEALKRNIPVIPIITSKAELPKENELPDSLKELSYRNAIRIRSDPDYKTDIVRLKNNIDKTYKKQSNSIPYFKILAIIALIGILGAAFFANWDNNAVEKNTWNCSDSIVGEYIEINPEISHKIHPLRGSNPAKLIFDSNGEGVFQYEDIVGFKVATKESNGENLIFVDDGSNVTKETIKNRFRWKKQQINEFLVAYIDNNNEITETELYTCEDNILSITIDDGATYKYRLIK